MALASLICGIVSLCCCNTLYLVSTAAIVLGIIALCTKNGSKGMAITGLCLGAVASVCGCVADCILSVFTYGASFFF